MCNIKWESIQVKIYQITVKLAFAHHLDSAYEILYNTFELN